MEKEADTLKMLSKIKLQKHLPGFTLIELALVLIILGILMGLGLPALTALMNRDKALKTRDHQQQVLYALTSFVLKNNYLPCPGDPSAPEDFGVARGKCSDDVKNAIGIVPFRTLGLPEAVAKGDGHWMTYAVNSALTEGLYSLDGHPTDEKAKGFCTQDKSTLTVHDLQEKSVLKNDKNTDHIAVVLVSHGPQGKGAFLANETANRLPFPESPEKENCNDDGIFIDRPLSSDPKALFSHTVAWVTRNNLLALYGHRPCVPIEQSKAGETVTITNDEEDNINESTNSLFGGNTLIDE